MIKWLTSLLCNHDYITFDTTNYGSINAVDWHQRCIHCGWRRNVFCGDFVPPHVRKAAYEKKEEAKVDDPNVCDCDPDKGCKNPTIDSCKAKITANKPPVIGPEVLKGVPKSDSESTYSPTPMLSPDEILAKLRERSHYHRPQDDIEEDEPVVERDQTFSELFSEVFDNLQEYDVIVQDESTFKKHRRIDPKYNLPSVKYRVMANSFHDATIQVKKEFGHKHRKLRILDIVSLK